jgi:predicted TPR repeat methyltransferase
VPAADPLSEFSSRHGRRVRLGDGGQHPENRRNGNARDPAMTIFKAYARYYDVLYATKDYAEEAAYVLRIIQRHRPEARTVLDLGCGTGAHGGPRGEDVGGSWTFATLI